jgi:hypothetical protein
VLAGHLRGSAKQIIPDAENLGPSPTQLLGIKNRSKTGLSEEKPIKPRVGPFPMCIMIASLLVQNGSHAFRLYLAGVSVLHEVLNDVHKKRSQVSYSRLILRKLFIKSNGLSYINLWR